MSSPAAGTQWAVRVFPVAGAKEGLLLKPVCCNAQVCSSQGYCCILNVTISRYLGFLFQLTVFIYVAKIWGPPCWGSLVTLGGINIWPLPGFANPWHHSQGPRIQVIPHLESLFVLVNETIFCRSKLDLVISKTYYYIGVHSFTDYSVIFATIIALVFLPLG